MADLSSVQFIPRATFNPASLTASYQALNGAGFGDDIKILQIYNGGAVGIDISFDGVTDHAFFPSGATIIIDFQTNHADNSSNGAGTLYCRKGQIIYGKTSTTSAQLQIMGYR
jgi:hypothetical protein